MAELAKLVDAPTLDFVAYVNANQQYVAANQLAAQWYGTTPEDIRNRPLKSLLCTTSYERIKDKVEQAISGEILSFETELLYPDDITRWIRAQYIPDVALTGGVQGYLEIISDITVARQVNQNLQYSERLYRDFFDSALQGIIVYDSQTEPLAVNDSLAEMFGYCRQEILSLPSLRPLVADPLMYEEMAKRRRMRLQGRPWSTPMSSRGGGRTAPLSGY